MDFAFYMSTIIPLVEFTLLLIIAIVAVFELPDTGLYKKLFKKKTVKKRRKKRRRLKKASAPNLTVIRGSRNE